MHKLYRVHYVISSGEKHEIFGRSWLFTEDEPAQHIDKFNTFSELYDAVSSRKYPWRYADCKCDKSIFGRPCVRFIGYSFDGNLTFTEKDFKEPVSVETQYKECSTKDYNFDFFRENLSAYDFVTFLREYGICDPLTYENKRY